jgi:hypothetical protein
MESKKCTILIQGVCGWTGQQNASTAGTSVPAIFHPVRFGKHVCLAPGMKNAPAKGGGIDLNLL